MEEYPQAEPRNQLQLTFNMEQRATKVEEQSSGYMLSTPDRVDVVIVTTKAIASCRLAPYQGWDQFHARALKNWDLWKRIVGYKKIQRLGVRYINRLDIPMSDTVQTVRLQDYLKFYPELPEDSLPPMSQFAYQVTVPLGVDNCNLVLNSAMVPSPVPGHGSFLLDLDILREGDVPQNDNDLWLLINRFREHKNRIFEAGITDKARALFR